MQVMDRLPQSVSAYIAHVICLPATINFRNARHWFFFQRSYTAVFVVWICCIVNITELLLKMDWSIGEVVTAIADCVPENVYSLRRGEERELSCSCRA